MANTEGLPLITSPGVTAELSKYGEAIQVDALVLGGLSAAVKADMPERLIVVGRDELVTVDHFMVIPPTAERQSEIFVRRHRGPYTTNAECSGYLAAETSNGERQERPKDLVVVTPSLRQRDLTESTAEALRNHPYLNEVARKDEEVRAFLDRWVGFGGIVTGIAGGLAGTWADHEGVPHTGWIGGLGLGLFFVAASTVAWTHNANPRRSPMPDLDKVRPPLAIVKLPRG